MAIIVDCSTGQSRTATAEEEAQIMAQMAVAVPQSVSPRQLKLALLGAGLLDSVEAFVGAAPREAQIGWAETIDFQRSNGLLNQMAEGFGLSGDQVDDIFRAAAAL